VHWKCGQANVMRISLQPFRNTDFDRSKATAECGIFKISGSQAINYTDIHVKSNLGLPL
jgi:hypothetical protein